MKKKMKITVYDVDTNIKDYIESKEKEKID